MNRAVQRWSASVNPPITDEATISALTKRLARSYTVYGTMLLLPPESVDHETFKKIFESCDSKVEVALYKHIAREMKITHIAINKPIPPSQRSGTAVNEADNILRAPIDFQPLYGDFGAEQCVTTPTNEDFERAYWVTAKQNGISQTWAPRWTMFSRGNISEKARLLELESVSQAVADGLSMSNGCAIVDLYVGIGYFTFSYLKAGFQKAICWELNPWSCEGLRRGTQANRWTSKTYDGASSLHDFARCPEKVLIFNESNELAVERFNSLRDFLPPVRHVNCGLLPTSRASWRIALECLDSRLQGWVHLHENFGVGEVETRAEEAREYFQRLLSPDVNRLVVLEHVNRVKTYAPGVYHCVIDLCIPPRAT